ncbi:MAG TPA: zinc dependent phospholipase C family protein [Candidatus Cloacimonadota bacterium]|nr:zinc dependent phospholipase C family protein [Candidatus Cloacimonadota bacterium]
MWIWDSRTHQFIVSQTLQKCSASFNSLLNTHAELFILGIEAPDRIFKDFTNHYYNCTPNQYGTHNGKVIDKIVREIEHIRLMLQNPDQILLHQNIAPFLSELLNTPLKAFIFEIGVLSHYIADLHQPMHTDGSDRFADEETVHKIMEADTRLHLPDLQIALSRRQRLADPLNFFTFQIFEINSFYDDLVDRYFLQTGKVKADRWQNSQTILEECISLAVMNIANVFLEFEQDAQILQDQRKYAKMIGKVFDFTDYKKRYLIKKYKSGTVSLQIQKR